MKNLLLAFAVTASAVVAQAAPQPARPTQNMQTVLDALTSLNGKPIETLSAADARQQPTATDAVKKVLGDQKKVADDRGIAKIQDIQVAGAAGPIAARVYTPVMTATALPIVVYFHGGGFVIATIDTYDASARALAADAQAIVVSVEYRKGPETKFPGAHDDAIAAYKWVLANAASFGGDVRRVAVAGESAGGNLALNVAIAARDQQLQTPLAIVAVYPVAGNDMNTRSYTQYAAAKPLNKPMMTWFVQNYLADMSQAADPRINLVAAKLANLPPTTIIAAQIDPLASEGLLLTKNLKAAGVQVNYKMYHGVTHEFFGMSDVLVQAKQAQNLAGRQLKAAFAAAPAQAD